MSTRKALSPKTSHHAYLILGGSSSSQIFGISEARALRQRASLASEGEEIIIDCVAMTEEAQNALLKTLEEPTPGLTFRILVPRSIQLLPTLLSRLEIIDDTVSGEDDLSEAEKFAKASFDTRLKIIADLIKQAERLEENPKSTALKFLDNLEKYLAGKIKVENMKSNLAFALAEIRQGRVYLNDKSGTAKLVLEHIAIVLPASE